MRSNVCNVDFCFPAAGLVRWEEGQVCKERTPWMLQRARDYHIQPIPQGPANVIALGGVGGWVDGLRDYGHRLQATCVRGQPVTSCKSRSAVRPGCRRRIAVGVGSSKPVWWWFKRRKRIGGEGLARCGEIGAVCSRR